MNAEELGAMIDEYVERREERLLADKVAANLKLEENHLKDGIMEEFHRCDVHMVGGTVKKVTMRTKAKPMVNDWMALQDYVKETGQVALYQKRLSEATANEMIESGVEIPGVDTYDVDTLSVSKL